MPRHGSFFVASGILLSRIVGFVRMRVFAHYFGLQSDVADAFNLAIRIPNSLQNLFGEGALSASFIPVYAALVSRGERREADRVAGAVASLLALTVALLVLAGVVWTPALATLIAPGFRDEKRALTIALVRVLFPSAGLLAMSAWCLGVLNSHRRFVLSYAAPVMWNAGMIVVLIVYGPSTALPRLAVLLAWGSVAGATMQFLVQVPFVLRVAPNLEFMVGLSSGVRRVIRNFVPALVSRGVLQISVYIDALLASLLPTGAVTGLANAQTLYTLPVSLFGMSVAAAELPAMAGDADAAVQGVGGAPVADVSYGILRDRLQSGLRRIAFFVVPSAVAFIALGDVVAAMVFQTGRFRYEDAVYVWGILAGSAVGLLSLTLGRLYSSTYFALHDTRTPFRCALGRVVVGTVLGYVLAIHLIPATGVSALWGAAGLTLASGVAASLELMFLRRGINRRIGTTGLAKDFTIRLWTSACAGAAAGWIVKLILPPLHPLVIGACVLPAYAATYAAMTMALGVPEAREVWRLVRFRNS
jgi:putative peptidoglycan lipid II flippase